MAWLLIGGLIAHGLAACGDPELGTSGQSVVTSIPPIARPTMPMSDEKRDASPAGASVCRCARSVPTSRANMVLRNSVTIRTMARAVQVSLKYCAVAPTPVRPITASGAHQAAEVSPPSKAAMTSWISLA
jgi:hypothetical protein